MPEEVKTVKKDVEAQSKPKTDGGVTGRVDAHKDKALAEARPAARKGRDIGIEVKAPTKQCKDKHCPYHGSLPVRRFTIDGVVVSDKMNATVVVKREYLRKSRKYERYERRTSRYLAHSPACLGAAVGSRVTIAECRPLSKTVSFVVIASAAPEPGSRISGAEVRQGAPQTAGPGK